MVDKRKKNMSSSIDPTSYIAVVRTAVWDGEDESIKDSEESADLIQWLATIGQDVAASPEKTTRFMAWAIVLGVQPPGRTVKSLALHINAKTEDLIGEIDNVTKICGEKNHPRSVALELLRRVTEDITLKRSKIQRLLNWLFVLRSTGPEFPTLQSIGHYCGVTRQAIHKDLTQIYKIYPYLKPRHQTPHAETNRRNTKLKETDTHTQINKYEPSTK